MFATEMGTMSKYVRLRKKSEQPQIEENEVRITTTGRVKKYVDYAIRLLEGPNERFQQSQQQQTMGGPTAAEAAESKAAEAEATEDRKDASAVESKDSAKETAGAGATKAVEAGTGAGTADSGGVTRKFETIVLKATGRAINQAVTTAEVVKRRVGGLHQQTSLETLEITDTWEPTEEGLKTVKTTRRVASITITLSRKVEDVDASAAGYQEPISATDASGGYVPPGRSWESFAYGGRRGYNFGGFGYGYGGYGRRYDNRRDNRGQRGQGGGQRGQGVRGRRQDFGGQNQNQRGPRNRQRGGFQGQGGGGVVGRRQQNFRGQGQGMGGRQRQRQTRGAPMRR